MLGANTVESEPQVTGLAGVVKAGGSVRLVAASSEDQQIRCPPAPRRFGEESRDVVGVGAALESVQKKKAWRPGGCSEAVYVDKVAIGGVPPLEASAQRRLGTKELSPKKYAREYRREAGVALKSYNQGSEI